MVIASDRSNLVFMAAPLLWRRRCHCEKRSDEAIFWVGSASRLPVQTELTFTCIREACANLLIAWSRCVSHCEKRSDEAISSRGARPFGRCSATTFTATQKAVGAFSCSGLTPVRPFLVFVLIGVRTLHMHAHPGGEPRTTDQA
jgi:hypothetical protein